MTNNVIHGPVRDGEDYNLGPFSCLLDLVRFAANGPHYVPTTFEPAS